MSQYEQDNDMGRGGGEVDRETMERAWENADQAPSSPAEDDPQRDDA